MREVCILNKCLDSHYMFFFSRLAAEACMDLPPWSLSSTGNALSQVASIEEDMVIHMSRNTTVLALAATVFSEKRFGEQAAKYVRAFFLDAKTGNLHLIPLNEWCCRIARCISQLIKM